MSTATTIRAHIACELIDDHEPEVMVIEFLTHEITGPTQARELREELDSLIWPELPHRFVIDFGNAWTLASTAFGEIVAFARQVGRLVVCNLHRNLRLSAALTDLDLYATFAASRQAAIEEARRGPMRGDDDTVDYPTWGAEAEVPAELLCGSGSSSSPASDFRMRFIAAKRAQVEATAGQKATATTVRPKVRSVAIAAGLTLDDFGGRSDALGG
jgi:hypothetical protein